MIPDLSNRILSISAGHIPVVNGRLQDGDEVVITRYRGDIDRWAIMRDNFTLNKKGIFVYQPSSSNRSDGFLNENRYDSIYHAFDFFQAWRKWVIQKFENGVVYGTISWDDELFPGIQVKTANYTSGDYDFGELLSLEKFSKICINDHDGFGHPEKDGLCDPDMDIYPSKKHLIPEDATHIRWFNR